MGVKLRDQAEANQRSVEVNNKTGKQELISHILRSINNVAKTALKFDS